MSLSNINYISTRGDSVPRSFQEVQLNNIASDGGLYLPTHLPQYSLEEISAWRNLSYQELSVHLLKPFIGSILSIEQLQTIVDAGYSSSFKQELLAPLHRLKKSAGCEYVLELFHGPTLSFKDYALQLTGRILDNLLPASGKRALVLGSTSGDTGSAAIAGYRGLNNIDIIILHPLGRVSEVQRRQMTTATEDNVHNIAIEGDYDACQAIMKQCLVEQQFLAKNRQWVTVNSINWARIMVQTIYYFSTYIKIGCPKEGIIFSVPTGNFGDIFAGYLAQGMGLPIRKLIAGVNSNSVLPQFFAEGLYPNKTGSTNQSLAPSMDIAVPNNLERLLFNLMGRCGDELKRQLQSWQAGGVVQIQPQQLTQLQELFACCAVNDEQLCQTIAEIHQAEGYLLDPHSAAGLYAGRHWAQSTDAQRYKNTTIVHIATADPIKFPQAIVRAIGKAPDQPPSVAALMNKEERYATLPATKEALLQYIKEHIN